MKDKVPSSYSSARAAQLNRGVLVKRLLWLLALLVLTLPAQSKEPFSQNSIVLLQPGFLLERRVSVEELSSYIKRLNVEAGRIVAGINDRTPRTGSIVFAVRPDGTRKVWLDLKPALSEEDATLLRTNLEATSPCTVREGTVVAAVNVSLWGGKVKVAAMPMPDEWHAAITGDGVEVTQLVDAIWPVKPAPDKSPEPTQGE